MRESGLRGPNLSSSSQKEDDGALARELEKKPKKDPNKPKNAPKKGAETVIYSAPAKDDSQTIVMGVNAVEYDGSEIDGPV